MGAWGTSLYSNDTTSDVRDTYIKCLEEQLLSNEEAYAKTFKTYKDMFNTEFDEEPLFWLALADTQWKLGKLTPEVKTKAIKHIDEEGGISLWEDNKKGITGWKKTLDKLRTKLEKEQPKEKHFKKINVPFQNPWEINDIYAYKLHPPYCRPDNFAFGKYILMQKIGEAKSDFQNDTIMRIHIFDRIFDNIPSVDEAKETIRNYRILPLSPPTLQVDRYTRRLQGKGDPIFNLPFSAYTPVRMSSKMIQYYKGPTYPKDELTYIFNMESPINIQHERSDMNADSRHSGDATFYWDEFSGRISFFLKSWQSVEYEIIGDGTFEYPTLKQQEQIKAEVEKGES